MPLDLQSVVSGVIAAEAMALYSTGERLFALDVSRLGHGARPAEQAGPDRIDAGARKVGLVPLQGLLTPPRMADFRTRLAKMRDDPDVGAIVMPVDSPGGTVASTPETADAVAQAAAVKPLIAYIDTLAVSAAYWISAPASQIWSTPSGEGGSIGVRALHANVSEALAKAGVAMTEISAGEFKTEGSPFKPLSEEALAHLNGRAEAAHGDFVDAVAKGRGVTSDKVRADFGRGRTMGAADAVKAGMVDRIGSMSDVIASLHTKAGTVRRRTALAFA